MEPAFVAKVLRVSFGEEVLDAVRRSLGQTQSLAFGPGRQDVRERVLELHGRSLGLAEIARETGLGPGQVRRLLERDAGREPRLPAISRLEEILRLRGGGATLSEIGRAIGYSRQAVRRTLAKTTHPATVGASETVPS